MSGATLRRGIVFTIRFFLAVVFITYGVSKLLGGQFYYGDWMMNKKTVGGAELVWSFYGYSPVYGRAIGLFEFIPAVMLLFRRTTTLGAAALFVVSLNVTIMDFCYGFPNVKYFALLYTCLAGLLVLDDFQKWKLMLLTREEANALAAEAAAHPEKYSEKRRRLSKAAWAAILLVGTPFVLFALNLVGTAIVPGPERKATEVLMEKGIPKEEIELVHSHYTGMYGIGRTAEIEIHVKAPASERTIYVSATRTSGFSSWRIGEIREGNAPMTH